MDESQLRNLSPLDGRYRDKTNVTREIFSEHALIIARIKSEASWLEFFLENFRKDLLTKDVKEKLNQLSKSPSSSITIRTKEIEQTKARFERYGNANLLCGKEGLPRIKA